MTETLVDRNPLPRLDRDGEQQRLALDRIQNALGGLRFGEVRVIVQDGVVVQVERTEKVRLQRKES